MFDFIHGNKRLIQGVLAILFLPFAFFGVDSYYRSTEADSYVAEIGSQRVTPQEFANALGQRQEQLRRSLGAKADPALLDGQDVRSGVLDALIRQRLLLSQAVRNGIVVSDNELRQVIGAAPLFQDAGKFSPTLYEEWVQSQGSSAVAAEAEIRSDIMQDRMVQAYRNTAIVPDAAAERFLSISGEQREVSLQPLPPEEFLPQVKLAADAAEQYYDGHQSAFQLPEQVRIDYLLLSADAVAGHATVSADEVRQYYDKNHARYAQDEQRRASHILIAVDSKATTAEKEAARTKAEQLLQQVRRNPAQFSELARKNSQDPGSAVQGGDLGWFARGAMVKPFNDVVFQMKPGEIAGPVETQYGYHIIRLDAVKGHGFDDIKAQVENDLKREKSGGEFSDLAEQLSNLAFEQSDSLQSAASALKLTIQHSGWLSRTGGNDKLLDNPKLLQAIFSDDALKNKHNTDAIDVGGNTLIVARVVDYRAASVRPFTEVSADIGRYLQRQEAAKLAVQRGHDWLDQLKHGNAVALTWSKPKLVNGSAASGLDTTLLQEVFKTDVSKLPAYAGMENPQGGYTLIRISRVVESSPPDSAQLDSVKGQLRQILGQEELNAYVAALKLATDVKVNQQQLEQKQQP